MKSIAHTSLGALLGFAFACGVAPADPTGQAAAPLTADQMLAPIANDAGRAQTLASTGSIDLQNPFFQSLGTNGRSCGSCHLADQGWTITPAGLQARFDATDGTDPIFRPHDGANTPKADVSTTAARRAAYSMLLTRGVIRVGLPVKATSEFVLAAVDDPYGFASAAQLSLFRRPLPTTNLRFLSTINWDGRNTPAADLTNIRLGLKNQSNGATVNHALATAPIADAVRDSIVDFELGLTTAQSKQDDAGTLFAAGATGGPDALAALPFALGANDPAQPGFTPDVFTLFAAWTDRHDGGRNSARADVADGERVFNEKTFAIGNGRTGTCSGCHSAPDVGGAASFRLFDTGVSSAERRTKDQPLYTFRRIATGETIQTTDPGRALISGKWADMNRFKVPGLRGLAAHAPYFHDGSAATIDAVVEHYEKRFTIDFSDGEKQHLVMFLGSL